MDVGRIGIWTNLLDSQPAAKAQETVAALEAMGYGAVWIPESRGRESFTNSGLLLAGSRRMSEYPPDVRQDIEAALAIGANVLTYATNRQLRGKLDLPELLPIAADDKPPQRGALSVVKLSHSGGSDDAPAALDGA